MCSIANKTDTQAEVPILVTSPPGPTLHALPGNKAHTSISGRSMQDWTESLWQEWELLCVLGLSDNPNVVATALPSPALQRAHRVVSPCCSDGGTCAAAPLKGSRSTLFKNLGSKFFGFVTFQNPPKAFPSFFTFISFGFVLLTVFFLYSLTRQ